MRNPYDASQGGAKAMTERYIRMEIILVNNPFEGTELSWDAEGDTDNERLLQLSSYVSRLIYNGEEKLIATQFSAEYIKPEDANLHPRNSYYREKSLTGES